LDQSKHCPFFFFFFFVAPFSRWLKGLSRDHDRKMRKEELEDARILSRIWACNMIVTALKLVNRAWREREMWEFWNDPYDDQASEAWEEEGLFGERYRVSVCVHLKMKLTWGMGRRWNLSDTKCRVLEFCTCAQQQQSTYQELCRIWTGNKDVWQKLLSHRIQLFALSSSCQFSSRMYVCIWHCFLHPQFLSSPRSIPVSLVQFRNSAFSALQERTACLDAFLTVWKYVYMLS
jgi:hypothetical protein